MRVPVTLLVTLSLLVSSLPLHALAEDLPVEPAQIVEPTAVPQEPAPEVAMPVEPVPTAPIEAPVEIPVPVIEEPIVVMPQMQLMTAAAEPLETEPVHFDLTGSIELSNGCVITDESGTEHVFPTATTTEYLAVCALVEAVEEGVISEVSVTDASFGLYVSSINGVAAGANEYWSLWVNGGYGNCGISCQTLSAGDTIILIRTHSVPDESDPNIYVETQLDRLEINVDALVETYDNILVPDSCSVIDTVGVTHDFPVVSDLLGVCALVAATAESHITGYELKNETFGLYVTSVNAIAAGTNEYWSLWINDGYANCGVSCQTLSLGDRMALIRTAYDPVTYAETQLERVEFRVIGSVHVEANEEDPGTGGTGGSGEENEDGAFDVARAFSYLAGLQEEDGSIENDLVTDWAAIAFSVSGAPASAKSLLKQYLKEEETDLDTPSDYIRHAMAMLALNLNPYSAGPEDYITPVVESFDGTQLGEDRYINDDVFALFPLTHAGYDEDDEIIQKTVAFLISQQGSNGSWEGIDLTAAAIQALVPLSSLPGVPDALTRAEAYLRASQESDGGFGDPFATPWVIQAIEALGDSPESWEVNGNTPLSYLASIQNGDGSVTTASGTVNDAAWATAYAIAAAKGDTWHDLLDDVNRQEPTVGDDDDNSGSNSSDEEDSEGEVLGTTDEITPEPLTPSFTFETPIEAPARTVAKAATAPVPATEESLVEEETDNEVAAPTQTASTADAPGGSWLMQTLGSLWSGFVNFLKSLFS